MAAAVTGSGIRHMSLSLIAFQPAMKASSEHRAFGENVLVDHRDVEGNDLPLAARLIKVEPN